MSLTVARCPPSFVHSIRSNGKRGVTKEQRWERGVARGVEMRNADQEWGGGGGRGGGGTTQITWTEQESVNLRRSVTLPPAHQHALCVVADIKDVWVLVKIARSRECVYHTLRQPDAFFSSGRPRHTWGVYESYRNDMVSEDNCCYRRSILVQFLLLAAHDQSGVEEHKKRCMR
eukprot:748313-Hanusia_phi.AAC.2